MNIFKRKQMKNSNVSITKDEYAAFLRFKQYTQNGSKFQGASGTINFNGIYSDSDYSSDWMINKYDLIEQMINDAVVQACLLSIKLPITQSPSMIKPASQDNYDLKVAEFVEKALFENPYFLWNDFQNQILSGIEWGVSIHETARIFNKGQILLNLAPRLVKTIQYWNHTNDYLTSITQLATKNNKYQYLQIANENLILWSAEKRGKDYSGISMLRAIYRYWYFKDLILKIMLITAKNYGIRTINIELPAGSKPEDKTAAEEVGETWVSHEKGYVITPFGYKLNTIGNISNMPELSKQIDLLDRQMFYRFLANFLMVGMTDVGSYGLAESKTNFFMLSLESTANSIEDVLNKDIEGRSIIPRLVRENFGDNVIPPKFMKPKIRTIDYDNLIVMLEKMKKFGIANPTEELKKFFIDGLELPVEETIIKVDKGTVPEVTTSKKTINKEDSEEMSVVDFYDLSDNKPFIQFYRVPKPYEFTLSEKVSILTKYNRKFLKIFNNELKLVLHEFLRNIEIMIEIGTGKKDIQDYVDTFSVDNSKIFESISIPLLPFMDEIKKDIDKEYQKQTGEKIAESITDDRKLCFPFLQYVTSSFTARLKKETTKVLDGQYTKGKINYIEFNVFSTVKEHLFSLSKKIFENIVSSFTFLSFNKTRDKRAGDIKSTYKIRRSEIMDKNICSECRKIDGKVYLQSDPELVKIINGAYDNCKGDLQCRGTNYYEWY